ENHAPVVTTQPPAAALSLTVGKRFTYDANALDADADPLTFDLVVRPNGMAVEPSTGITVWQPRTDQIGTHDAVLRVQDGRGGVALQPFRVTVQVTNTAPVVTSTAPGPATDRLPYRYPVKAQDADGDQLTFSLVEKPSGMTIDPATGVIA